MKAVCRSIMLPCAVAALNLAFHSSVLAKGSEAEADPREQLETAIPEAIRLLEAKDYVTLLKNFAHPEEYKELTKEKTIEEFAKEFGNDKAADLLKALSAIKGVKPSMRADGKRATFKLNPPQAGLPSKISWAKIEKYWYIED